MSGRSGLASSVPEGAPQGPEPRRGMLIGRYVVLSKLGAGSMGVVFAAYDPELDRKVALKLLSPHGLNSQAARIRLQREAQALAKLSHANIVAVHDVGLHEGKVFIAMEFVVGQTLGQWMARGEGEPPRPWREVVRVFSAAGHGLAVAHGAGLIHRDFKPDNVMLGDDDRVRVMDFGLARSQEGEISSMGELEGMASASPDALEGSLTRTGALMGTPAYMAPEQLRAKDVTIRSDQFGFCVALHRALYGIRPFPGKSLAALLAAITANEVAPAPRASKVPAWLRQLVLRGLSAEPGRRYATMNELVEQLETGEARRRNRAIVTSLGVGLVAAGTFAYQRPSSAEVCERLGDRIDEVWNPQQREALAASLVATGAAYAPPLTATVTRQLDDYAESWRHHTAESCTYAAVDETWKPSTVDRARWCLEERRIALSTLVSEFQLSADDVIQDAVQKVAALPRVATCVDIVSLSGMGEPPPLELRAEVNKIRQDLSLARSLNSISRHEEGLELVRAAHARAESIEWPPLIARALAVEAWLLETVEDYEESEAKAIAAYALAGRSGAWDVAASVAVGLSLVIGYEQARVHEGKVWAEHARLAISHLGDPLGLREADRLAGLANILGWEQEFQESIALHERALSIRREALGAHHPHIASSLNSLGAVHQKSGDYERARTEIEEALAIWRESLGPNHPNVGTALNNLGAIYNVMQQWDEARDAFEESLKVREIARGPEHTEVATSLTNLASVYRMQDDHEAARPLLERALGIYEEVLGPSHPRVASTLDSLAVIDILIGAHERARRRFERALEIQRRVLGPEHVEVGYSLSGLASLYQSMGEYERAREYYEQTIELWQGTLPAGHPNLTAMHSSVSSSFVELGMPSSAIEHLEIIVANEQSRSAPMAYRSQRFMLARLLWDAADSEGGDRSRARRLAEQAREIYERQGESEREREVEEWLATHPAVR